MEGTSLASVPVRRSIGLQWHVSVVKMILLVASFRMHLPPLPAIRGAKVVVLVVAGGFLVCSLGCMVGLAQAGVADSAVPVLESGRSPNRLIFKRLSSQKISVVQGI